ncbi:MULTISPECIES: hypothetical protein [unclassified Pseudomonas]|uniref:hypothetical protein n=1 Tax=unclassified Pseudomonas TaxID=196821 RepID=UPI00131BEFCA|nr:MULTISPECIES: hypothetical protein [unclassified Pseudomonas]
MEDPLLALLYRLNDNQMALGMAIEELTAWVVDRGSVDVGKAVELHMITLEENSHVIADALADLIAERAGQRRS